MQEKPSERRPRSSRPERRFGWREVLFLSVAVGGLLLLAGPRVVGLVASSTLVAVPAVLGGLALGVPLAVLLAKTDSPWRGGCRVAVVSLVLLPLPVFTTGWLAAMGDLGWLPRLFADGGPVRGWLIGYPGAIALHAIAATPWIALLGTAAVLAVDRRREEQALLDSPAGRVLWSVTLRDAAPALVAIGVVVAVLAATEMTITDLLRVRTFAEEVYTQAAAGQLTGDATDGSGMLRLACGVGVLSVIAAAAMMPLTRRLMSNEEAGDAETWHVRVTRYGLASWLLLGITALLTLIPLASLAYRAGVLIVPQEDGVQQTWSATKAVTAVASAPWQHRRELSVSITLAAAVATGAMLVGAAVAWAMRNSHTVRWLSITLAAIAMAIPGPVVGVFVIRLLNQPLDSPQALLGDLYGTWFAPWLAQMIRISPIALLLSWPGVAGVSHDVLNAARSDGAGFIARIVRVALPLCWPSLAATWLVAFAWSIGELSATVLVVPPGTPPLSVRLLSLLHYGVEDRVAAICLVLVIGYVFVALLASRLLGSTKRTQIEGD